MSMSQETLLLELFTEELPPKALKRLGEAFAKSVAEGLTKREFCENGAAVSAFATPRRLAVQIANVRSESPAKAFEAKLMPVSVGLDANGTATPALLKKMAAMGIAESEAGKLTKKLDGKAEALFHIGTAAPVPLQQGLQAVLDEAIKALPIPKVMTYQIAEGTNLRNVQFVRPVHGLVAMHGETVVPVTAFGLAAGNLTHGHRFQGAADITLKSAADYEAQLEKEGAVVASFDKRMQEIEQLLRARAEQCGDTLGERADYVALLEEVTALVERPAVYVGKFDAEFLSVPPECLILTMKLNQKYFPLFLSEGGLSSRFLVVSNMRVDNPHRIIEGNERVVRPRLADAKFFFEQDKKKTLESRLPGLAKVVYHAKLGSQEARMQRVLHIADQIAAEIGADREQAKRAAKLAKADLLTDMVGEFPELQGIMGRYYAEADGEAKDVAAAIQQHYQPRFAGDALPVKPVAIALALADKMETLAGMFGIGMLPTGDKDPFALRRHALGVLRILMDKKLALPLDQLTQIAFSAFDQGPTSEIRTALMTFFFDRLRGMLRDQGYSANEVEAVVSQQPTRIDLVAVKLAAVRAFMELPEAESLAAANKRIGNILKKSADSFSKADAARLVEPAEKAVHAAMTAALPVFEQKFAAGDYTEALKTLAPLKAPVDAFFDGVMVNADDPALRQNRLALLGDLHALMNRVADLSQLAA